MTKREWVNEMADGMRAEVMVMDGYDDCIVGIVTQGSRAFVVYDRAAVIQTLIDRGAGTEDEAMEFHQYNQAGLWIGDGTWGFLDRPPADDEKAE